MTKRAFIVHGWGGYPEEGWFPWLTSELQKHSFDVQVLAMPHSEKPTIDDWVGHLAQAVDTPDSNTYLVGHSVGCQTIMRYLETVDTAIGGAVFVGGFFDKVTLESEEEEVIGKPWLETPINFEKVRQMTPRIVAILSDNDPIVPLEENRQFFKDQFGIDVIVEHDKEHFSGSEGITELPSALQAVLDMAG